jgi:tRNA 2-thiouridine synthesizing protein A
MPQEVDARGLSCPQPVLMSLQAIQSSDGKEDICVIVDNQASVENVSRAATAKGWTVADVDQSSDAYRMTLHKG